MLITSLLAAYIVEEQTTTFDQIVNTLLQSGQGLQDVIELLEQDLTSCEDRVRNRATLLIALLLEQQPLVKASSPVLHLFIVFFSRRMQDYASISPCLTALTTILKLYATNLDPKFCDLLDIIHSTTKSVHIPSYAQNVRQKALELLRLIIDDEALVRQLRGSGDRLLEGLANCIEGEKDPRCLLTGLRSIHLATVKFASNLNETIYVADDQLTIAEYVFDVVSRYYPISFAPSADDPIGITSEVLAAALDDCICQTKAIATFAISFLIDQLILEDSDIRVAALTTLSRIVREHGVEILITEKAAAANEGKSMGSTSNTKMIIDHDHDEDDDDYSHAHDYDYRNGGIAQLRRLSELLFEASIHEASERILTGIYHFSEAVSRSICGIPSIDSKHPIWQVFIEGIIAKVLKEVQATGLDNLKARGAWRLCRSIGQGGGFKTCGLIIEWFLPTAMKGVEESAMRLEVNINRTLKAIHQRIGLLPSLSAQDRIQPGNLALLDGIIQLSSPLEGGVDVSGMKEFQLLSQDRVVSIMTLIARFIRPFAIDTLPSDIMIVVGEEKKMHAFDDDAFIAIGLAIGAICELLSRALIIDDTALHHQLIKSVSIIAMEGMKYFIHDENVLKSLHHMDKISPKLQASTRHCLESLSARQKHIPTLLEIAYPVLIASSDHLGMELIASMAAKENGVTILQHLISQLTEAITEGNQSNTKKYIQACYTVLNDEKCVQVKQKAELFTIISSTLPIITQLLQLTITSNDGQITLGDVSSLLEKIMQQLVTVDQQMALFSSVLDFVQKTSNVTSRAMLLRSATLYLDKTAVFFTSPLAEQVLLQLQGGDDEFSNQAMAIVTNKIRADCLQRYLSQANFSQWSQSLLVWTTKALILRPPLPHPNQSDRTWQTYFLDSILNGLDDDMASRLQVLVSESDGVLEKANRGYFSPFWQQKLFATFYPRFKDVVHKGDSATRVYGMLSFCYVVHGLSPSMLRVQLEEVVDTVVYILSWLNNTHDRSVQSDLLGLLEAQVVPAMTRILQEQPVAFVDHLQTILPRLLQMAKSGGEARLRVAAIDCLTSLLSHVPYSKLHPYKAAVLKTLQAMLDDKKRVVRQKAATVRNEWMLRQT